MSSPTYMRPDNLSFPQIYSTFKGKDKNCDKIIEYRIQDLPEEYFDQAVDFMTNFFLTDETLCTAISISSKPGAIQAFRGLWRDSLKKKVSIGCFRNDKSGELVGLNVLIVKSKSDAEGSLQVLL